MTNKTPQPAEVAAERAKVLVSTTAQFQNSGKEVKEKQTASKEVKPAYQTYIYRSYGGGYQGL